VSSRYQSSVIKVELAQPRPFWINGTVYIHKSDLSSTKWILNNTCEFRHIPCHKKVKKLHSGEDTVAFLNPLTHMRTPWVFCQITHRPHRFPCEKHTINLNSAVSIEFSNQGFGCRGGFIQSQTPTNLDSQVTRHLRLPCGFYCTCPPCWFYSVSREIFGHYWSRSYCFQDQQVRCCHLSGFHYWKLLY
jgi:hypothetical protein